MEESIKIRSAALKDLEIIFNFICHLEETSFEFAGFKNRFTDNLDSEHCLYLVAVNDQDEPVGFISCQGQTLLHHEGRVFEIQEIYVARNFRDKGIGKALVAAVEEKLADLGCECLEVTANTKRTDARKFYKAMGFQQTHVKLIKEL